MPASFRVATTVAVAAEKRRRASLADAPPPPSSDNEERLDGEVVDARADTDRRRVVDLDVGDDVRAVQRHGRSCAKHEAKFADDGAIKKDAPPATPSAAAPPPEADPPPWDGAVIDLVANRDTANTRLTLAQRLPMVVAFVATLVNGWTLQVGRRCEAVAAQGNRRRGRLDPCGEGGGDGAGVLVGRSFLAAARGGGGGGGGRSVGLRARAAPPPTRPPAPGAGDGAHVPPSRARRVVVRALCRDKRAGEATSRLTSRRSSRGASPMRLPTRGS